MSDAESYDGFIIDGAQYAKWGRSIFEEMRSGGVTCVNVTLVYWAVSYTHLTLPTIYSV